MTVVLSLQSLRKAHHSFQHISGSIQQSLWTTSNYRVLSWNLSDKYKEHRFIDFNSSAFRRISYKNLHNTQIVQCKCPAGGFHPRLSFLPTHRDIVRPKCSYNFCRETGHLNEFYYKMKSVRSSFLLLLNPHCCASKSNSKIGPHRKFILCMLCSVENVQLFVFIINEKKKSFIKMEVLK